MGRVTSTVRSVCTVAQELEVRIADCDGGKGSGCCHRQVLGDLLGRARRRFTVREDVSEMSAAMAHADLAVCSFGMTSYELAAMGVPAVCVCLTEDHAESASALVAAGMGISVGVDDQDTEPRLAVEVERLLANKNARAQMSARGRDVGDGGGPT